MKKRARIDPFSHQIIYHTLSGINHIIIKLMIQRNPPFTLKFTSGTNNPVSDTNDFISDTNNPVSDTNNFTSGTGNLNLQTLYKSKLSDFIRCLAPIISPLALIIRCLTPTTLPLAPKLSHSTTPLLTPLRSLTKK